MAPVAFRKPYLNMLREATVAQKPRAHFDPCRSEAFFILRLSESWKPGPARCLETRLLPVSHPADAPGDRLYSEVKLECFRTPTEKVQNQARKFKSAFAFGQNRFGTTRNLSLSLMDS